MWFLYTKMLQSTTGPKLPRNLLVEVFAHSARKHSNKHSNEHPAASSKPKCTQHWFQQTFQTQVRTTTQHTFLEQTKRYEAGTSIPTSSPTSIPVSIQQKHQQEFNTHSTRLRKIHKPSARKTTSIISAITASTPNTNYEAFRN